jgi:hypothetical protein
MAQTIFQQYETRKTKYKPGTIWKANSSNYKIQKLQLVPLNSFYNRFYDYNGNHEKQYVMPNCSYVYFRVVEQNSQGYLPTYAQLNALVKWTTEYLEQHYAQIEVDTY